jgi:hypothetical protein
MKNLFVLLVFVFIANRSLAQEYYKIQDTKHIIRFYPNLKINREKVNDTLFLETFSHNEYFTLILKNAKGHTLCRCNYNLSSKEEKVLVTTRVNNENTYKKSSINVKVLVPQKEDCLRPYVHQFW